MTTRNVEDAATAVICFSVIVATWARNMPALAAILQMSLLA
jgi:hypothetical protein